jgi:alpha-galactosidase/6-phospho-beta-glucosidase family protein
MKLTILGGGGVRVPLLVNGLVKSDLPIDEIALFDIDRTRVAAIAALAERFAGVARVTVEHSLDAAVDGASFIVTSIRVGGIERRAYDEQIALSHGLVGQETVGPAGFAMAMRTIPPLLTYARTIERRAPNAWIINFTNPVGIVTQAIIPLNVLNRGSIDGLEDDDVVEVPCVVGAHGARPQRVGSLPDAVSGLVHQVKEYERLTVRAALGGRRSQAVDALARNPLVPNVATAARLVDDLLTT